jgi:hypothetical protein
MKPASILQTLVAIVFITLSASGCEPDLGPCREDEARILVFDRDGYPAYVGQALMQVSCGNGAFCHSSGISAVQRLGAPHGLDFDMIGSRTSSDSAPDTEALARLDAGRKRSFDWRHDIYEWARDGTMPPGEVGDRAAADDGGYIFDDGSVLPTVGSKEGLTHLRRWLACGSPVVSVTRDPDASHEKGSACEDNDVGTCIVRDAALVPDPTWSSIYDLLIAPRCVSCHGPGPGSLLEESQLDMRDASTAYDALVGIPASGEACNGDGTQRVVASDSTASLLIHKLTGQAADGSAVCGEIMPPPPASAIPREVTEAVAQWIDEGANDN